MVDTLDGITIEVKPLQPLKAKSQSVITSFGITVFLHPATNTLEDVLIIALQLFRESKTGLSSSTQIEAMSGQYWNAPFPIEETLLEITIEVNPLHPANA